jgi:DNA modification methylase
MTEKHDIIPQRTNANRHTERGMRLLEKSIAEDGWIGAVTVAANGETFDGSARVETTAANGMLEDAIVVQTDGSRPVVVVRSDIPTADDPRAKRLGVGANQIAAENLSWDSSVLASLVTEIDLTALFQPDELAAILADVETPEEGAGGDDFDATPEDGPTRTQSGELWLIGGKHRLIVGDCTNPAIVERLMGGDKFEMAWTDPPYGVAIGDKNKYLNSIAPSNRVEENLENDTLDEEALLDMLRGSFALAAGHCLAGGAWYVAAPPGPLHVLFGQALKELNIWHQTIQWVKNNATFAPLGVDYHWRAEPIFYGWLPGAAHRYYGGRQQDTVWEIDRPQASPEHPTMKPVELVQRAIENSSRRGEIAYDPFLGSGTTLIAAHRTGRRCYGCEISPKYCDVVIRRAEADGLTVERAADG